MGNVIADMSMSLDGYVADRADGIAEVFAWFEAEGDRNARHIEGVMARTGAVLTGRRTSDLAAAWGGQHPAGVPTFVVSHRSAPEDLDPTTSTVHFVDDLEEALRQAKQAAGTRAVAVAGGQIVGQLLALGVLDELHVSLVPVVLGGGVSFFGDVVDAPVRFKDPEVTQGDGVTQLAYRLAGPAPTRDAASRRKGRTWERSVSDSDDRPREGRP